MNPMRKAIFLVASAAILAALPWSAAQAGGIRPGQVVGQTDDLGFSAVERIHVHDLQATVLHLLGLDHTKLTFKFQGSASV